MPIRITIDIFSGRPNPVVELDGKNAKDVLERLQPTTPLAGDEAEKAATPILGYRGLVIEQTGTSADSKDLPARFRVSSGRLTGKGLAHNATDTDFEQFFFSTKGPAKKAKDTKNLQPLIKAEVARAIEIREQLVLTTIPFPIVIACTCGPLYEPTWWNDGGQKQLNNNCHNYATNYRSDTFAQPGRAAGAMYTALSCASVLPAAVKDALEDAPGANNKCPSGGASGSIGYRSQHRLPLVSEGTQRILDAQTRRYGGHQRRQQRAFNHRPAHGEPGNVHSFLYLHGGQAWTHQNQVSRERSIWRAPRSFRDAPTQPGRSARTWLSD